MERWPTVYDANELAKVIRDVRDFNHSKSFFDRSRTFAQGCQGDIIRMQSDLPLLDQHGSPVTIKNRESLWLLIGNTCDFTRSIEDLRWTQLVPILPITNDNPADSDLLQDLRSYRLSRYFYIPDWSGSSPDAHYMAEFPMPVTVDKRAIGSAELLARLSISAWTLLHACLVRFLCRDDGRFQA